MSKTVLAIDFDGTIAEHRFPALGNPVPGAFAWLKRLQSLGVRLILLTMRSDGRTDGSKPLTEAVDYCKANGIEFWAVNENPEQATWTCSRNVFAHGYIDDAAIGVPLIHPLTAEPPFVDWDTVGPLAEALVLSRA